MCHVDGGPSGGSRVRIPRSEDPHQHERFFFIDLMNFSNVLFNKSIKAINFDCYGLLG